MSTKKTKTELAEAIEKGLENHSIQEAEVSPVLNPAGFEDTALGHDTQGKGNVLQTKEGPHDASVNQGTIKGYPSDAVAAVANAIAGKREKKKDESGETEMKEEISIEEYLASLFDENELSEDFKEKLTTIFATALADRIAHVQDALQETFNSNLNDQVENITEDLSEKLDEFLSYVVNEWTEDNKLAIERGIKADIAESFMNGLKDLFDNHYIEMPDEKVKVMEELLDSKNDLEEQLNKQIETNITLQKSMKENAAKNIFIESCSGMTDTEIEKYAQLAETIEFEDLDEYSRKLFIIKESFMGTPSSDREVNEQVVAPTSVPTDLTETTHETIQEDPMISAYTKALSFQNRNRDK